MGDSDLHEQAYSHTNFTFPLVTYTDNATIFAPGHCVYSTTLYFSKKFHAASSSHLATISTISVVAVFLFMAMAFAMYDRFVRHRNDKIMGAAARSNGIISSLFPSQVRDRLFAANEGPLSNSKQSNNGAMSKERLLSNESENNEDDLAYKSMPIADLFPETTVLFADIAGFTAWSSVREPCQVFILLETLFHAFDTLATKRRVFKVRYLKFGHDLSLVKTHTLHCGRWKQWEIATLQLQVCLRREPITQWPWPALRVIACSEQGN
jgi:Adenylate and Guanylate cyclase catalytic domain